VLVLAVQGQIPNVVALVGFEPGLVIGRRDGEVVSLTTTMVDETSISGYDDGGESDNGGEDHG